MPFGARRFSLHKFVRVALLTGVMATVLSAVPPASASSSPETFITMMSEAAYSGGSEHYYYPATSRITVTGNATSINAEVNGGSYARLSFTAPTGENFKVGDYEGATRYAQPNRAGIYVYESSNWCSTILGRFRVNEITVDANGKLTSAWIFYELACQGSSIAQYGEVRFNVTGDPGTAVLSQRMMRWKNVDLFRPTKIVPIRVWNPGSASLGFEPSTITGPNADEFQVRVDECKNAVLAQNETCNVLVKFAPKTPGFKDATLRVPESGGAIHRTSLSSYVNPGGSRFYYKRTRSASNTWAPVDEGQYDLTNADFSASGGYNGIRATVSGDNGVYWHLRFQPKEGDVLAPGEPVENVEGLDYYEQNVANARISVSTGSYYDEACADNAFFQIHSMNFDGSGALRNLRVTFDQPCNSYSSGPYFTHGIFEYRVGELMDRGGTAPLSANVSGAGEIVSTPGDVPCTSSCTENHPWGSTVTATAVPDPGHVFTGWSGACKGTAACTLRVTGDRTLNATFVRRAQTLTVTKNLETHASGSISSVPDGITCGTDCTHSYQQHHEIDLTAVPGPRSSFTGWSGGCTGQEPTCSVVMSQDKTVTAHFALTDYRVRIEKSGSGMGTVSSSPDGLSCGDTCLAMFARGTPITLTAEPSPDSVFRGFSEPCGDSPTCTFTPSGDVEVHARFKLATSVAVSVQAAASGYRATGSLEPSSASSYARLTLFQLTRSGAARKVRAWKQELDSAGRFSRIIGERPSNRCRLKMAFPGNEDYAPSTDVTNFAC